MTKNSLLLTQDQAIELLPFGRRGLEEIRNKGEIGFKKVGRRYYYLRSDIEQWVNDLTHHTDYTSEVMSIGHTSPLPTYKPTKPSGLDALLAKYQSKKPNNFACKKYQKFNQQPKTEPSVNCLA